MELPKVRYLALYVWRYGKVVLSPLQEGTSHREVRIKRGVRLAVLLKGLASSSVLLEQEEGLLLEADIQPTHSVLLPAVLVEILHASPAFFHC